ncbi:dihydrodipicolinate synthase family protein [Falsirhodobacter deserti]|uniref:dihydrodipicolinate synthase family protein n=1 Tax=Falsirhodobacter deserti TaxID=1365611 RepID=UPI000FE2E3DA|nr:dihydrodipicolinate synthase family protein [Falsirhodobacter deserti]
MNVFRGLSAFPLTPADADGRVDTDAVKKLISRLSGGGVDSIGLLGSTGSYAYLSRDERRRALDAALEEASPGIPVMAGVAALRTSDAVKLAKDAKDAGAKAGLLSAMAYLPLTQDEMFAHFEAVAGESGLPLCIYDNPGVTNFRFGDELLQRLAEVPGVEAIKNPTSTPEAIGAHLAHQRALLPQGFSIGYSGDWNCPQAMIAGGDAWYSVLAGILPRPCQQIIDAVRAGDHAEAERIDIALQPIWRLFRDHTSFRVVHEMASQLAGLTVEPPRPVLPVSAAAKDEIATALRALPEDMLA